MKFTAKQGNFNAVWNQATQKLEGDAELVANINLYVSVITGIGNDAYLHLIDAQEALNIQVLEYEPDVYPEGTLDV